MVQYPLDQNSNGTPDWKDYEYLNISSGDGDRDGLLDWKEIMIYGTDPNIFDMNSDLLSDAVNIAVGLGAKLIDTDGDGISNVQELLNGTSPVRFDTDGDGVSDKLDDFPLDRFKTKKPAPNLSDHTPPVITLQQPF